MLHPCSSKSRIKKLKEKEKENRNNLDILPSHDKLHIGTNNKMWYQLPIACQRFDEVEMKINK